MAPFARKVDRVMPHEYHIRLKLSTIVISISTTNFFSLFNLLRAIHGEVGDVR
jgi:hypothetical protein